MNQNSQECIREMELFPGEDISTVADNAISLARLLNKKIMFNFNEIEVYVISSDSVEDVIAQYWQKSDESRRKYEQSQEYKDRENERQIRIKNIQIELDEMVQNLPNVIDNDVRLVHWVKRYAEINDYIGVDVHAKELIKLLEEKGFVRNEHVNEHVGDGNSTIYLKWLMGQVLDCFYIGMPIHPCSMKFCDEYLSTFTDWR